MATHHNTSEGAWHWQRLNFFSWHGSFSGAGIHEAFLVWNTWHQVFQYQIICRSKTEESSYPLWQECNPFPSECIDLLINHISSDLQDMYIKLVISLGLQSAMNRVSSANADGGPVAMKGSDRKWYLFFHFLTRCPVKSPADWPSRPYSSWPQELHQHQL